MTGSSKDNNDRYSGNGGWFDRHFQWRRFLHDEVTSKSTIKHRSHWDYLRYSGTVALALVIIQAITGLLLLLYYTPDAEMAFGSLTMIRNDIPFGMLFSNIHSINSNLLILTLFVHMFWIMIISAHRGPREPQWYGGVILLLLMLLTGFSGYLLPWSQQSFWACVIGTESVKTIPLLGDSIASLLRGGDSVNGVTLHRFFAFHVTFLPACISIMLWIHLKRVWKTGVIAPPDARTRIDTDCCTGCRKCERVCSFDAVKMTAIDNDEGRIARIDMDVCNACRACIEVCPNQCISLETDYDDHLTEPIFPDNIINRLKAVSATIGLMFFSSFFLHWILMRSKVPADPMITPDKIKPEWYFLASYQVLKELPSERLGLLAILAVVLLVFFLPVIDRSGPRRLKRRPLYLFLVGSGIAAFIYLSIKGLF